MNEAVLFSDFYCHQCGSYLSCSHITELAGVSNSPVSHALGIVRKNLSNFGFLVVREFATSPLYTTVSNLMLDFFRSDMEQKLQFVWLDRARRGYCPSSSENFASLIGVAGKPNDTVEKFRIGPVVEDSFKAEHSSYFNSKEGRIFYFPNNLDNFPCHSNDILKTYYAEQENAAKIFLTLIELACELPSLSLSADFDLHTSILTFNYYSGSMDAAGKERIAEHTDVSMFTLVSELIDGSNPFEYQVLNLVTGEWETIQAGIGDVIFNVGDWLQDCSNGRLKSARHRVIEKPVVDCRDCAGPPKERMTSAFFFTPRYDSPLDWPIPPQSEVTPSKTTTYVRWRKQLISAAMAKLKK